MTLEARATTDLLAAALIRQANAAGGFALVVRKGDPIAGTLLVQINERGRFWGIFERVTDLSGTMTLSRCGPAENAEDHEIISYIDRRVRSDTDLWLIELDIADGERLAARILSVG